jgi:hypothetical protein
MIAVRILSIYTADPLVCLPCWLDGWDPFQPVRTSRDGPEDTPVPQPNTHFTDEPHQTDLPVRVGIPRRVRHSAMPFRELTPADLISSMMGRTLETNDSFSRR